MVALPIAFHLWQRSWSRGVGCISGFSRVASSQGMLVPVDPPCHGLCLEEIIALEGDFYLLLLKILFVATPSYNFVFCFSFTVGEKGGCATNTCSLNMLFQLTIINRSCKAKALYLMGISYTTTFFWDTILWDFFVFCSLARTTAGGAENIILTYLLLNLILCVFEVCEIHNAVTKCGWSEYSFFSNF